MKAVLFVVCALVMTLVSPAFSEGDANLRARAFDLPLIGSQGFLRSSDLFPLNDYTFLVFWDSSCPRCVESLLGADAFFEEKGGGDLAVVGIHTGPGDPFEVEQLLKSNDIDLIQLWDIGGEASRDYGVVEGAFTLFVVGRDGRILGRQTPLGGHTKEMMEDMLSEAKTSAERDAGATAAPPEPTEGTVSAPTDEGTSPSWAHGFVFHGDERLRFLSIDSHGKAPVGPYGEALEEGNSVLYRFDLEVSRRISRRLRLGGLLRITNEDEEVLELGPEYLGSPWGSAFAEVIAGRFSVRLGYYRISMTPLTLMRWDWDDNPRIGGNAGCGCAAAAGVLLVESLEELGPDLVFEGATAAYRISGLEARAFYAIPRRANEIAYDEYYENKAAGEDPAGYSLEIAGGEARWRRTERRTGSSWAAGVRVVTTWEDDQSVNFTELGYRVPDPWTTSTIVTADWNVPLVRYIDLRGEWMIFNEAEENREALGLATLEYKGKGGIAGVAFERSPGWRLRLDYLYLDPDFYSPFSALSYAPNREGARVSVEVPLHAESVVASVFYKRLRETETPHPAAEKEQESDLGVSLDAEFRNGLGGSLGWLDSGMWRQGAYQPTDDVRKAFVAGARYRFDKTTTIELQYQWLKNKSVARRIENESTANVYSVYMSARF